VNLNGRVALVTGSGRGLGRSHALLLARYGAKVIVNDMDDKAEVVAAEIIALNGEAIAVVGSVTDEAQVAAMVQTALTQWGRIDILVNNAGILRDSSFGKMSIEDFRQVIDVHLTGAFICTKAVWEAMRSQRYGRIVMTTSSSGLYGNFGQANYGAAKMALVGLMQTLSIEGAKSDIKVNCLAPTAATSMTDALLDEQIKNLLQPDLVSAGLIKLVADDAPTRSILCAGAGYFEAANITLTRGAYIGAGQDAAQRVIDAWEKINDRTDESVPKLGTDQIRQELAAAAHANNISLEKA
jgi:NAD(P)-dependent dehydrogenase (short-subunit alcohol dehydrogenase family)